MSSGWPWPQFPHGVDPRQYPQARSGWWNGENYTVKSPPGQHYYNNFHLLHIWLSSDFSQPTTIFQISFSKSLSGRRYNSYTFWCETETLGYNPCFNIPWQSSPFCVCSTHPPYATSFKVLSMANRYHDSNQCHLWRRMGILVCRPSAANCRLGMGVYHQRC